MSFSGTLSLPLFVPAALALLSFASPAVLARAVLHAAELAESIADQAEERADKLLDRPFLRIATLALLIQSATTAIQNLVSERSAVCESPIELAMCFALAIVAREGDRGVTFAFPDGVLGDVEGTCTSPFNPRRRSAPTADV